jgi:hemerythrin-like domain-containing protein
MSTSKAPWADTPFKLIPTPGRGEDLNKLDDATFIARDMANAHNGMLRALNSIYQQCIFIEEPNDIKDLLLYTTFWCDWIHEHHEGEETFFFPQVETITGVAGLMEVNVAQHHTFITGLKELHRYAKETTAETYDGMRLRTIIDGFGGKLTTHLTDEIQTLLGLKTYDGPRLRKGYMKFDAEMRKGDKASETFTFMAALTHGRAYCSQLFLDRLIQATKRALSGPRYQGRFEYLCIIGLKGNIRECGDSALQPRGESVGLLCSLRKLR